MLEEEPLIVGAGPAGCAAAIVLARGGAHPLLVDRDAEIGDALCGGFLSWRTAQRLRGLGVDPEALGAHPVERLLLFGSGRPVEIALPKRAFGLSRKALDTALRKRAVAEGARFAIDTVRQIDGLHVAGRVHDWQAASLFLATGKHDVRGAARPRSAKDPALGLRLRVKPSPGLARRLAGTIELHLFDGGYAGIVLQEDGSANICLAVRKSLIGEAGANPSQLLARLAVSHPHFALRLESDWREARVDTIGSVPYGWSTQETEPGVFRLGDQAAVIPSLAGEGIDIALASGIAAGEAWLVGGPEAAPAYQQALHDRVRGPLTWAGAAWGLAERPTVTRLGLAAARFAPSLVGRLVEATRLD
ncbi:MAG TPA: FAD-dependent monooxygenase [Croceibacterium sp.]|nr:FAD-dependent monooxygenase [Croceibacterium sp.]